jgi:hypothetical protein
MQRPLYPTEDDPFDHWTGGRVSPKPLRMLPRRKNFALTGNQIRSLPYRLSHPHTQLRGTVSTSNIEILECFQSKTLRMIVDAPWYVPNTVIRRDAQIPTVKEEIRCYSSEYSARLSAHPNDLTGNLMELPEDRRLRKHLQNDLPTRFLV